jgi:hypothetical protein
MQLQPEMQMEIVIVRDMVFQSSHKDLAWYYSVHIMLIIHGMALTESQQRRRRN